MLRAVLKNSSYLLSAQLIAKVLSFFYAFYLARQLGVVEFGNYSIALSYFSVLSSVVDLGVSRYLIREVSKKEFLFPVLFVNSLLLRLIFAVALVSSFGLIFFFGFFNFFNSA
jgi:O-antigen/teichoic acid export membrane protein